MTFDEALGCAGLSDKSPDVIRVLRTYWDALEAKFAASCNIEDILSRGIE